MTAAGPPRGPHLDEEACRAMTATMEVVGRRWSAVIMIAIGMGAQRFGEVKRLVGGISDRMLSQRLKELVDEGLVVRTVVPTTPAHSVYTLSDEGRSLMIALQPLVRWGTEHAPAAADRLTQRDAG